MRSNSNMTPPGRYWVKITGQGLGKTSKGNTQLVLEFQPLGPVNPQNSEEYVADEKLQQTTRRFYRVLNENTQEWATEDLKTLGFKGDSLSQLDPKHPRHWSFKDQTVMMFCQHDTTPDNQLREQWAIARVSPLVKEEASSDQLRELDALFAKSFEYLRSDAPFMPGQPPKKQSGKQEVTVPAGGKQEITDEDLPF